MADTTNGGDQTDDLMAQARRAEQDEVHSAQSIVGGNQVANEQAGYQQTLDAHRDAGGSATEPPGDQPGLVSRAASATLKFGEDAVMHPVDNAEHGWNGVMSAAQELIIAGDSVLSNVPGWNSIGSTANHQQFADYMRSGQNVFGAMKATTNDDNSFGNMLEGVTHFVAAKAAMFGSGAGEASFAASAMQNMGTMAAAFNPKDTHLTDLMSKFPVLGKIIPDAMTSQSGDSEWKGRLLSAMDGLGFEVAGKAVGGLVSWISGVRSVAQAAEDQRGIETAKPLTTENTNPAPKVEPEVKPEATPEVTPGEPAAEEPKPEPTPTPWKPASVDAADTAEPKPAGTQVAKTPEEEAAEAAKAEPKPGEPAPVDQTPPSFFPKTVAMQMLKPASYDQSKAMLDALREGRYLDMPNMLDDTHRTMPWDSMSDAANMKGVFNAVEDQMGALIKEAHGTAPVPREQIQQMAQAIGGDTSNLQRLYQGTTGEGGLAARITAGYNMLLASGRQLKDLAGPANALDATTPEGAQAVLDFQKQLSLHAAIVGQVRQSSAEIGRALWAHRYLKASSDVALNSISEYAGTKLGPKALKDLARQVSNSSNLSDLTNVSDQVAGKGWKSVLQEVAQNGMLSGPTTQVTNIVGNVGNGLLKVGERYVAAGIGSARKVVAPNADVATFREAWAHTMGSYEGLKKGAQLARQAMKDENFTSKFSPPTTRAVSAQNPSFGAVAGTTYAQAVDAVGKVIRWPGRFMGLFDHFTQSVGYEGDLAARAYKQSASEADAKGLVDDARDKYMGERQAYLKVNPLTDMEKGAMAAGKYSAFLEDPATKFGGGLMKAFNSAPILKLVVAPFIHRPGNMLRQGIGDYTPLAPLFDKNMEALQAGGSSTDLALARMTVGTGTLLGSYEFAQNGQVVGQRLGNKNTQALDGVPPYSAKIGNSWYKFDRLDPVGLWLGLGADLHEAIQHHYDPNDPDATSALTKASTAAVQAISHVAMDKSFMKSVEDVTAAMSAKDPTRADVLAAKLVQDNVAKLLPFSGLARALSHGTDDSARATAGGSLFDGVVASIPYLSQELPPRRDLLGRPVQPQSWWNPFNGQPAASDQMDQELSKLAMNVDVPSRTINGYTLNAKEWDEVVSNATQTPIIRGMKLEDALRYETGNDTWAANAQAPDGGALRNGGMAQSLINSAYNYGRTKYLMDHPSFNQQKQSEALERFQASIVQQQQPAQQQPQ